MSLSPEKAGAPPVDFTHLAVTTPIVAVDATTILTLIGIPVDTETVTIGDRVYTFNTALVDSPNNVLIGVAAANTVTNLVAAIEAGAGAGTTYGTGTVAHADVDAVDGAGDTIDFTADVSGSLGNLIATDDSDMTNGSFTGAFLASGAGIAVATGLVPLGRGLLIGTGGLISVTMANGVEHDLLILPAGLNYGEYAAVRPDAAATASAIWSFR